MRTKPLIATVAALLLAALLFPSDALAQRRKPRKFMPSSRWSVRVALGMPSDVNTDYFTGDFDYYHYGNGSLDRYYGPYTGPVKSTGALSVAGEYLIARWFAIEANLSTDMLYCSRFDPLNNQKTETRHGVSIAFVPMLRFYYLNRPKVRLYGGFGLGAVAYLGYNLNNQNRISGNRIYYSGNFVEVAGQYVPIGVEFGRKIYGFAECGTGTLYSGVRAGVGIKL